MKKILLTYIFAIMSATCFADGVNIADRVSDTLSIETIAEKYFRAFPEFPAEQIGVNINNLTVSVPAIIYYYEAETSAVDIQISKDASIKSSDIYWTFDKKHKTLKVKSHKGVNWMRTYVKSGDIVIRVYAPKDSVNINIDSMPIDDGGLYAIKSEKI